MVPLYATNQPVSPTGDSQGESQELTPANPLASAVTMLDIASLVAANPARGEGEDPDHVRTLAQTPGELPPILVHARGLRVIDGMHRVRAAQALGRTQIAARLFDGDAAEAFVLAVRANTTHGLPLSLADRKAAASRITASYPHWSDRRIASISGLSSKTVAEIRRCQGTECRSRVGQDGRVRPINAEIGRRQAAKMLAADPTLSLRQVARVAGISPETVRDVRNRLGRGDDVQPSRPPEGAMPAHDDGQLVDVAAAVRYLSRDPSVRFSDSGRALLRVLSLHALPDQRLSDVVEDLPPHCRGAVIDAARACSRLWLAVAQSLDDHVSDSA